MTRKTSKRRSSNLSNRLRRLGKRVIGRKATRIIEQKGNKVIKNVVTAAQPMLRKYTGSVKLGMCASKYLLACADPFDPRARACCIPVPPATSTYKGTITGTTSVVVGTAGWGFVAFTPNPTSNCTQMFITGAAFSGTSIVPLSAVNTTNTGVSSVLLSSVANAGNFIDTTNNYSKNGFRIVSVGARITYTGTELNLGGVYYAIGGTNRINISGASASDLANLSETVVRPITRKPFNLIISNANESECDTTPEAVELRNVGVGSAPLYPYSTNGEIRSTFQATTYYTSATAQGYVGAPVSAILINSTAGNSFTLQFILHYEAAGPSFANMATPNEIDISGATAVMSALAGIGQRQNAYPGVDNYSLLMNGLKETAIKAAPMVLPATARALAAML